MQKTEIKIPILIIFFSFLICLPVITNAVPVDELYLFDKSQKQIIHESKIIDVSSDFFLENNFKRYLIFGSNELHTDTLKNNSLYGIQSDHGFFYISVLPESTASNLISHGYHVIEDTKLDFHQSDQVISDVSRIGDITGSTIAKQKYNSTGNDIVIAIVDTGVDFSNPDIQHSLARDEFNNPLMLDPDGQGIILTNATFAANLSPYDTIRNFTKPTLHNVTSSVYHTRDGVFLDISQGGNNTIIQVYNSLFPQFGSSPIFNGTLSNDMKIGFSPTDFIKSESGIYHLGVMYQGGLFGKIQVVPVLVVDSISSGIYDTIIPDLSTSWLDYTRDNSNSNKKLYYVFYFTD